MDKDEIKEAGYGCLGIGCIGAFVEILITTFFGGFPIFSCLGCVGFLLLIAGAIYLLHLISPVIVAAVIFAPSILLSYRWLRFNTEPGYQSLEKYFCRCINSKPTKDPMIEVVLSFFFACSIQLCFYAIYVLVSVSVH